jgi:NTE family protein
VRVIELGRDRLPRRGPASKLNRDPAFLRDLITHGREQAERFLTAFAFERAWSSRDTEAVMRSFAPDAAVESAAPFPEAPAVRDVQRVRSFVSDHLCDDIQIDPTHKQVAQDRATWKIRMRHEDETVPGVAEAEIGEGRVTKLRIGV